MPPPLPSSSTFGRQTLDALPFVESPTETSLPDLPRAPYPGRLSVFRRDSVLPGPETRRRWSVAGALMDEGVSDEFIVEEVETMRRLRREWRSSATGLSSDVSHSGYHDAASPDMPEKLWIPSLPEDFFDGIETGEDWDEYEDILSVFGGPTDHGVSSQSNGIHVPFPSPERILTPWSTTRRTLLVIRELLKTERAYLASLRQLLSASCTPAPPALMLTYARELETVSAALLESFMDDMTVWGVAKAFLVVFAGHSADDIDNSHGHVQLGTSDENGGDGEKAFSRWTAVVGQWFSSSREHTAKENIPPAKITKQIPRLPSSRKQNKSKAPVFTLGGSASSSIEDLDETPSPSSLQAPVLPPPISCKKDHIAKSLKSTWRRSMPTTPTLTAPVTPSAAQTPLSLSNSTASLTSLLNKLKGKEEEPRTMNRKKLTPMRDLAILPTQRVVRYVLLYRGLFSLPSWPCLEPEHIILDLLAQTPQSSAVYPLIQRATETSLRVARQCDRAQDNAAFLLHHQAPST